MTHKFKYFLLSLLIAMSIMGATGFQVWQDYNETKKRQETTVEDIAKIVESQVIDTVTQTDNMLLLISDYVLKSSSIDKLNPSETANLLQSYCKALLGCNSIGIINTKGFSVINSIRNGTMPIDVSDRAYFQTTIKTQQPFISPAIVTRLPGKPVLFHITKPVINHDGKLIAIVVAGMETSRITDFYGLMGFGISPTVSVFKGNGDMVARYPNMQQYIGKNISKGTLFAQQLPKAPKGVFKSLSPLDNKHRLAAYTSIKNLDMVVFAGIEEDIAFQAWSNRSNRLIYTMLCVLFIIGFILYYAYRTLMQKMILRENNKDLQQDNKGLNELAHIDSLTGIANRRTFDTTLAASWIKHEQDDRPLSILLIDIDFFKAYNDNYGHQQGDICLYQVAQALKSALHREIDLIARYGGEEFVVILNTTANDATIVAERMRVAVESLAIPHGYSKVKPCITVSIGIASTENATMPEELISFADQSLYKAKKAGKNTYVSYSV
jgi:diguanylate cyclase (GGDEF)-like protein